MPRDVSMAVAGGDRRGGKTFNLLMCLVATCLDVPSIDNSALLTWAVSVNYQERDEIDRTIRERIPRHWYHYRLAPEFRYMFLNGATLKNISADDPETLKRGRVDVVFYNEAQKMSVVALSNGILGTTDKGGIALLAANPPRRSRGEWVLELKESIEEERIGGARFFGFSSKDNEWQDRNARSRVSEILSVIDPKAAAADDGGMWLPVGDRAYSRFDKKLNLFQEGQALPLVGDITAAYTKKLAYREYGNVGGADFQGTPHHAGVIVRVFGSMTAPTYYAVDEIVTEESVEEEFLVDVDDKLVYEPGNLLWIGDASGQWQDGKHDSGRGRQSFDIFKKHGWHIKPPVMKKTDKGEWSKNPNVDDRLNLVNKLLATGRLIIDQHACPKLAEALKDCPISTTGRRKPFGRFSHITDALGYVLFWLEPRPKKLSAPPAAGSMRVVNVRPSGPRML